MKKRIFAWLLALVLLCSMAPVPTMAAEPVTEITLWTEPDHNAMHTDNQDSWCTPTQQYHCWDDGIILLAPTCTENGQGKFTCTVCGAEAIREVWRTGHNYQTSYVDPTCTEDGYGIKACTYCGDGELLPYLSDITRAFQNDASFCKTDVEFDLAYMIPVTRDRIISMYQLWDSSYYDPDIRRNKLAMPRSEFEALLLKFFATDANIQEALSQNYPVDQYYPDLTYDVQTDIVTIYYGGGSGGGWGAPDRIYQGYVQTGDTYDIYFVDTTHLYLYDMFPSYDDMCAYVDALGRPSQVEYNGHIYQRYDSDDYDYVESIPERSGRKATATYDGETVRILKTDYFTAEEFPDQFDDSDGKALGHSYTAAVTDPTCTTGGFTVYTCHCGDSYTADKIPALNHNWADAQCLNCGLVRENPFSDVSFTDYFLEPVLWAVEKGITSGTGNGKFSPNTNCTRGQVVTFLWRAMGQPKPASTENPFSDVTSADYFYDAVLWAVENGITSGTGNGKFSPNAICTRGQVVTFLWRAMNKPEPASSENPFADVTNADYFFTPVLWAVENGITSGTGNGSFSPNANCTRGQVVTFLYRAFSEK